MLNTKENSNAPVAGIAPLPFINPLEDSNRYPLNDIGAGNLFADIVKNHLSFLQDKNMWYFYDGKRWQIDESEIHTQKYAKDIYEFLTKLESDDKDFIDFVHRLARSSGRQTMIREARSVYPKKLSDFDTNPFVINCLNGTVTIDEKTGEYRIYEHRASDFITKIANVEYNPQADSKPFEKFISQIMLEDVELAAYLQKSLGYGIVGETSQECLFVLYGPTTRNGKGTLMESVNYLLQDYAKIMKPSTLAQRKDNANAPSPDIARLAGTRLLNVSELPENLKLNSAQVKKLTGGGKEVARLLHQNYIEFEPQFKIFIDTNHLPEVNDTTLFDSNRLRIIPFDKHFASDEQNTELKKEFRKPENVSAIFNWLLAGYNKFKKEGLEPPERSLEALREYQENTDNISLFLEKFLEKSADKERIKTAILHEKYMQWCKNEDISPKNLKEFVNALRQKNLVIRDGSLGNIVKGYKFKEDVTNAEEE